MAAGTRFLTFAAAMAASTVLATPAIAASTYYASPTGTGTECSQAAPCRIETAATKGVNGDSVVVAPGTYPLAETLAPSHAISFGGQVGGSVPIIETTEADYVYGSASAHAVLHDLRIEGPGGLVMNAGSAERIFVSYDGTHTSGCGLAAGTALIDSVCWSHDGTPVASAIYMSAAGAEGTTTLRNVTAIAANEAGSAIFGDASGGGVLTVDATNVIARASKHTDVRTDFSGFSGVHVTMKNSSYSSVEEDGLFTTVTAPGTNGNQTAPPSFVAASSGNFAEATGSPTIDAGLTEAANGATALAGESRVLPGVCNGTPVTDVGAYEFVPTCAPSTLPLPPAQPAPAPSNLIKLGKLKRNLSEGTATLLAWVPDGGTLTLSGKGLKKVVRRSKTAAKLKLPIKPVGWAKRQLAGRGSAKVKLKVTFLPLGGTSRSVDKGLKLTERLG